MSGNRVNRERVKSTPTSELADSGGLNHANDRRQAEAFSYFLLSGGETAATKSSEMFAVLRAGAPRFAAKFFNICWAALRAAATLSSGRRGGGKLGRSALSARTIVSPVESSLISPDSCAKHMANASGTDSLRALPSQRRANTRSHPGP